MKTTLTLLAHCPLPIAHCPLPIAHCPLPIACCLLLIAFCLLPTDASAQNTYKKVFRSSSFSSSGRSAIRQTTDSGFVTVVHGGVPNSDPQIPLITLVKTNKAGSVVLNQSFAIPPIPQLFIYCEDIQPTADGGYILVGWVKENGGNDKIDGFVLKADASGAMEWSKRLGKNSREDWIHSVQQTGDGGYALAGRTASFVSGGDTSCHPVIPEYIATDAWLIKLDSSGAVLWTKTFGNTCPSETGDKIIQTQDKGFMIMGESGLLLKTDSLGAVQWSKRYTVSNGFDISIIYYAHFLSIQQTTDKGFIIAGSNDVAWLLKVDSLGNSQWNKNYFLKSPYNGLLYQSHLNNVFQEKDKGYVFTNKLYDIGGEDLIKTDSSGNILWYKDYSSVFSYSSDTPYMIPLVEGGYALTCKSLYAITNDNSNNDEYLAGTSIFLVKADTNGNVEGGCQKTICNTEVSTPTVTVTTVTLSVGTGISVSALSFTPMVYSIQDSTGCFTDSSVTADFFFSGVCAGDSTRFYNGSQSAITLNSWNFGDPASGTADTSTLVTPPKHLYTAAGTYTVTLIATRLFDCDSAGGFSDTIAKTVTIGSGNFLSASPDVSICLGASTLLTASGATQNYYWYWQTNGIDGDSITVSPDSTTIYRVSGSNGYCSEADSVTVTVIGSMASITGQNSICSGDSAVLSVSDGTAYLWNTGSKDSSITVSPSATTAYWVAISNSSCTDTAKATITVMPNPVISAGEDVTINYGSSTPLSLTGNGTYGWSPQQGLSCTNCQSPTATPEITTVYYLTVTDANGCSSTDSITVFVFIPCGDIEVFVPNAFSPNKDGNNDVLYVNTKANCVEQLEFKIYDRWGNRVFQTANVSDGWDGTYKGKAMDPAVFAYYLEAIVTGGKKVSQKGNISLIR